MQKTELTLADLTRLLINGKVSEGKSDQTIEWYEDSLCQFITWLERQHIPPTLESFTLDRVRAYAVYLQQRDVFEGHPGIPTQRRRLSDHSINSYLRALRAFSSWLYTEEYTTTNLLKRLTLPRLTQKVQDILSPEEIVKVTTSLNPRTEIGARDQAIFMLVYDSGIRLSEVANLCLADLHLEEGYAIVFGKARKERPVRIGSRAAKAVRFYLLHWRKPARPNIDHVFLTCRGVTRRAGSLAPEPGEPLKPNAIKLMIKRIGRAAGIPRLHTHLLRHTFSCHHLMVHRDPFALKSLLGHTTLAMTNHYCAAVQQMDIVRADRVSVLDGLNMNALNVNRRGRLPKQSKDA